MSHTDMSGNHCRKQECKKHALLKLYFFLTIMDTVANMVCDKGKFACKKDFFTFFENFPSVFDFLKGKLHFLQKMIYFQKKIHENFPHEVSGGRWGV